MRIIAVADTHLYHRELDVPPGDVFIHAGDMCRRGDLAELERAAGWICSLPHAHKIVVAGNHDWAFVEAPERARALLGPNVVYLEDAEAMIGAVRFWGSPWQPEFCDWAFNLPRGRALAEKWARIPEGIDVLVTHCPPEGFGDRSSTGGRHGCADLLARVRIVKPRLHVFGHIHEDGGVWSSGTTKFANVTTWECERAPTVIELDRDTVNVNAPPRAR